MERRSMQSFGFVAESAAMEDNNLQLVNNSIKL